MIQAAAASMEQKLLVLSAANAEQVNNAFSRIVERKADAIVYSASPFFQVMRDRLVTLAA